MAEELYIPKTIDRKAIYESIIPQVKSLVEGEPDLIANMANISAVIHTAFGFLWCGFYIVKNEVLVLGPFQGPLACTRIQKGNGVCGTSWDEKRNIIVPDVEKFPGHIACSHDSRSEIVIPGIRKDSVVFVLDIDSSRINDFNSIDEMYLNQLVNILIDSSEIDQKA